EIRAAPNDGISRILVELEVEEVIATTAFHLPRVGLIATGFTDAEAESCRVRGARTVAAGVGELSARAGLAQQGTHRTERQGAHGCRAGDIGGVRRHCPE